MFDHDDGWKPAAGTTPDVWNPLGLTALETIDVSEDCPPFLNGDRWKSARPTLLDGRTRCARPADLSMTHGALLHSLLQKEVPAIVWPNDNVDAYSVMAVVDGKKGTFALVQWRSASHPSPGQGGSGGRDEFSRTFVRITDDQADRIVLAWNEAVASIETLAAEEDAKIQRAASMASILASNRLDTTSVKNSRHSVLSRMMLDDESIRSIRTNLLVQEGFDPEEIEAHLKLLAATPD